MLSDFVKWIRKLEEKRILEEGIWGSWDYKIPTDKKEQMYDFYTIAYLLPPGVQMGLRRMDFPPDDPEAAKRAEDEDRKAQGLPPDPRIAGDAARTIEDKFYYALYEAADKLLPHLKNELLNVVEFAVAAELRHLWDHSEARHDPKGLIRKVKNNLGPKEAEMLRKFAISVSGHRHSDVVKKILDQEREKLHPTLDSSNVDYKASYRSIKEAGGTTDEWMKLAAWLFENVKFDHAYGGKPWAQIAEGWLGLNNAKTMGQELAQIDHVYDLQHNTDTVFNKVQTYAKNGSYDWVKEALDHKRYLVSPHEFIEHVSPSMRELALIGIKLQTGKSWHQFENEWPEILKKKTEIHNDVKHSLWKNNKDAYYKQYFTHSEPLPLTPDQFTAQHIKPSNHPWSVYHFGKQVTTDIYNATDKIPAFNDIQIGDQVALAWPAKVWYVVQAKNPSPGGQPHPTWGVKPDALTLSDVGETPYNMIKGYRPKSKAQFAPTPAAPATPVAASWAQYLDSLGKKIDIGDTVKKKFTVSGKQGKVIELSPHDMVSVQWPAYSKSYPSSSLTIVAKANAQPKEQPPKPKEPEKTPEWPTSTAKPWHGIESPFKSPAKKPAFVPPTPEEKAASDKDTAKKIFEGLPKVSKALKYARVIRGMGGALSLDKMLDVLEKSLEVTLTPAEREAVKKAHQTERETEAYYQHRGHYKFPQSLTKDQAWDSLQQKFPNPPHVSLDGDTLKAIEDAVFWRKNDEAVKLIKKATQFNTPAAVGFTVLKGLESYMNKKI